jgi:hypothetical protein
LTELCFQVEDLGTLDELDPDHPRLLHLDRCPRCRSLDTAYREFRKPSPDAALDADLRDSRSRLTATIRKHVYGDGTAPSSGEPGSFFGRLFSTRLLRPAGATAAVMLTVVVMFIVLQPSAPPSEEIILRGSPESTGEIKLFPPLVTANGSVEFRWATTLEAESYQVLLRSTGLDELARLEPVADTVFVLLPDSLPTLRDTDGLVFWQVIALRDGNEIAISPMDALRLP